MRDVRHQFLETPYMDSHKEKAIGWKHAVKYIENSEELTGYKAKEWKRDAFVVRGFAIVEPAKQNSKIPAFYETVTADGRLDRLETRKTRTARLCGHSQSKK